jgi:cobalt-zinc-cadmium efflux system membrane fusion protein
MIVTKRSSWPRHVLLSALALATAGCGARAVTEHKSAEQTPRRNPLEIEVGPDLARQIQVGLVPVADVTGTMKLAGRVEADETRMARVNAPVTGRVIELKVAAGQMVKRGELLATIHSTDLSAAQSAFLKAASQQRLAERAVARAPQLLDAGVIGEAELQRRDAELQQAIAELSSSRDQLSVLGMTADGLVQLEGSRVINSLAHVVSTIDGRVLDRKVTMGELVEAAETVCVVADLSNVWLVADVPEQSARLLRTGLSVEAEIPALPGHHVAGKLSFVSAIVNPETRTVRARMDLPNSESIYKPAMLATITLREGSENRRVVPAGAVVRENNQDHVFVQAATNTFTLHPVILGLELRSVRVLESGLGENDRIVLDGAFHLNNERKRRSIQGE